MKAITVSQPYASLIAAGEKWVENRIWPTRHRGPLAIHAGKGTQYLSRTELEQYPTGQILAVADLVACFKRGDIRSHARYSSIMRVPGTVDLTWTEVDKHEHCQGPWCWVLQNLRRIEPITMNGKQRLWDAPIEDLIR